MEISNFEDLFQFAEKVELSKIDVIINNTMYDLEDCKYIVNPAPIQLELKNGIYHVCDGNHRVSLAYHQEQEWIWAWKQDLSVEVLEAIEKYFY